MRKLKFYLIGLIPGILIVLFVLNKKGASCSYFPNDRVIAETLTKNLKYSAEFQNEMKNLNISEKFVKDSILSHGEIDFNKSHAQKDNCPDYLLQYPKKKPKFEITFEKCKEDATFLTLKKL